MIKSPVGAKSLQPRPAGRGKRKKEVKFWRDFRWRSRKSWQNRNDWI